MPENPQQEEESFRLCGTPDSLQVKKNNLEGFVTVGEASKHIDHAIKGEGVVRVIVIVALGTPHEKRESNQVRWASR